MFRGVTCITNSLLMHSVSFTLVHLPYPLPHISLFSYKSKINVDSRAQEMWRALQMEKN